MARLRTDGPSGLALPAGFMAVQAVIGYAFPNVKMNPLMEWVPVAAHAVVAYANGEGVDRILLYLQDVDEPFLVVGDKLTLARQIADALDPDDGTL